LKKYFSMEKTFLSFHFSLLLKGKQRPLQFLLAGTLLALALVSAPALFRFLSGGPIKPADFLALLSAHLIPILLHFLIPGTSHLLYANPPDLRVPPCHKFQPVQPGNK
jgi:hypothetical protein